MATQPDETARTERAPDVSALERLAEVAVQVHDPGEAPDSVTRDVHQLADWIRRHEGVASVLHHEAEGTIVVRYDDRLAPAKLLQGALLDRLRAIRPPRPAEMQRLEVSIAHEVPGRVRLRVGAVSPRGAQTRGHDDAIERLASFVATLPGVERARASPASGSLLVMFDERATTAKKILEEIAATPPSAWPGAQPPARAPYVEWVKTGFSTAVLAGAITGVVPAPLMLGAVAITAIPPFRRAIASLASGRVNVDVMDATAITVCLIRTEPITASVITSLLALGDLILDRTHARARTAISRLMQLDDGEAYVMDSRNAQPRRVHPRELKAGMLIVVYPGARVPADGVIIEGSLAVDEKALTGESVPRERFAGDRVMAASVAVHGQAVVEVERAGGDTVAARIVQILEGAGAKPMTLQRNAEKYADRLVLPTFGAAGAAWAFSGVVDRLTSVLITDFGTGVRVAVPTAALAAMTLAAREGVLVKGATFLERLSEADTIVFDKTGTLTLGVPEVTHVVPTSTRFSPIEIAAYAAAAEGNQSHPIADAIRRHAEAVGASKWEPEQKSEAYRIGLGLEASVRGHRVSIGNPRMMREAGIDPSAGERARDDLAQHGESSVLVAIDGELAAVIGYADAPRPESAAVVAKLKAGGRRRVLLLSGDAKAPVEAIAKIVGIDEAIADVLPENKAEVVRRLKAEGRKVAMVGDGINDAPALAVADIGISLHGGTDVALETADVVLLEGGLERMPAVFDVSDHAMARVKQVLGIVLVPNALAIAAGALGFINPVMAATINNGSTIAAAAHAIAPLLRRIQSRPKLRA
jgi:Cu2+-exporting ATPase